MESRTILVVEDEALVAEDLRSRLVSLRFHVPTTVSEADEAVRLARELRPDLVLMDIMLHGNSDGIRAAETIWRELSIPIVFLTAYTDENTLRMAGATEPFGYLVKPFTDRELLTCLKMAFYKVEAERALRASEARLRTLVQLAPIAIAMTDGEGRTALWNRAAEGIMGYQEAEVTGRFLLSLLAGSPEMERAIVERVGAVGRVEGIGVSALTKGGASIDIELSASRLDDGAGGPGGMVVVWRDVTEQRRVHRQMMSRLLTYDVREGRIYLAKESSPAVSLRVFHELLSAGYKGTRLSRAVRAGRGAEAPAHDIL
ncbi:MAG: PAS domain S-box protein, partial [Thermoplasmatota archaeon]